ncbi:hypothetical protein J6590_090391 [Homalodisca vitripennis]|nr:hypothetical protein J6590_090391 [Homalodisca vitripennis]
MILQNGRPTTLGRSDHLGIMYLIIPKSLEFFFGSRGTHDISFNNDLTEWQTDHPGSVRPPWDNVPYYPKIIRVLLWIERNPCTKFHNGRPTTLGRSDHLGIMYLIIPKSLEFFFGSRGTHVPSFTSLGHFFQQ